MREALLAEGPRARLRAHGLTMASGYFPLERDDPEGERLIEAADILDRAIRDQGSYSRELECTEDGVTDGMYLGELNLALRLIRGAVKEA